MFLETFQRLSFWMIISNVRSQCMAEIGLCCKQRAVSRELEISEMRVKTETNVEKKIVKKSFFCQNFFEHEGRSVERHKGDALQDGREFLEVGVLQVFQFFLPLHHHQPLIRRGQTHLCTQKEEENSNQCIIDQNIPS